MAQILLTIIDQENGSLTATFTISDRDIKRIFDAYKRTNAEKHLKDLQNDGKILEAYDTVEETAKKIATQDIVEYLAENFIETLSKYTYQVESNLAFSKIYAQIAPIKIE